MIQFNDRGLVPAIVQDAESGRVLMHAFMNEEALSKTLEGPHAWFYSRSRKALWEKGESSGNYLNVVEVQYDCDGDTVLVKANPVGPTCHNGTESCFDTGTLTANALSNKGSSEQLGPGVLADLLEVIQQRVAEQPEGSYTVDLVKSGPGRVAQKVVEEAGEVAIAAVSQTEEDLANEMADLLYHNMVLLAALDISPDRIWEVLAKRRK